MTTLSLAKSVNIASADSVEYYNVPETPLINAHAVYGASAKGGYIVVGKASEKDGSQKVDAFAVKLDATGNVLWVYISGYPGDDAFNAVTQLSDGGDFIAVGYRNVNGANARTMIRLNQVTGLSVWIATSFGDTTNANGGYENIALSTDNSVVYVAGFSNKATTDEYKFKSYGNVGNSEATLDVFEVSALSTDIPPTSRNRNSSYVILGHGTVKSVGNLDNSDIVLLTFTDGGSSAQLLRLAVDNSSVWTLDLQQPHGEGTELAISVDYESIYVTGHGKCFDNEKELCIKLQGECHRWQPHMDW